MRRLSQARDLVDNPWVIRIAIGLCAATAAALLSVGTPPVSAGQRAGISSHLMWGGVTAAEQDRQLGLMASAGGTITRVDIGWSSLEEYGKGQYEQYYLDRLDTLMDIAERHGVDVLITLTDTPCWASSAPESVKQGCQGAWWERDVQRYPPVDARDYADALAFLVRRYGDRVAGWEIWNEPNQDYYFRSADQPADYARIVRAAYPAAKAADPSATVIAGSIAEAPVDFVEKLFRHGIGGHFDAFSIHPYSGDRSPLDPLKDAYIANSFPRGTPAVRDVLLRHGEDKPIWLTEFGWNTSTLRGAEPTRNGVTEPTQALYIEWSLNKVGDWPYVPVAIVYELQDPRYDPGDREAHYGLLRYDGTFKPAFEAFRRGAAALASGRTAPPFGTPDGDPPRPLRVWLKRREGRAYARGVGEPHMVVRVRAYRYHRAKQHFARRAWCVARVRVRASGRFVRRMDERLAQGRWRLRASYRRSV